MATGGFLLGGRPARFLLHAAALPLLAGAVGPLAAATISVPNASFEAPTVEIVDTNLLNWQKTPKPFWFDEANGPWDQLVGVFANTPPGDPRHIENCDGNQAIWIFALPTAGLFQDYNSVGWSNVTHAFEARFEAGKSYQLTVGALVGAYPMGEGAILEASLYYRDAASNRDYGCLNLHRQLIHRVQQRHEPD